MLTRNQFVGISLIVSAVLTLSTFFTLTPDGELTNLGLFIDILSYLFLVPVFFILHALYKSNLPTLSYTALITGILGILIYCIANPFIPSLKTISGYIGVIGLIAPIMLFGICAYLLPQFGLPRAVGVVGILTGVVGIINLATIFAGGGDWKNPNNNPAFESVIFTSYAGLIILSLIWSVWTGIILLSKKEQPA